MSDCFAYPRVSSDRQEKEGHSIPYQIRVMSEYAEREDLNIIQIFTEIETAAKPGRPQFNALVAALRHKGAPKIVLVDTTDRLTRNDEDKSTIRELINNHGVEFRFVRTGAVWDKNATPDDEFMQDIEVAIAKRYINHLRRETRKGITQKIITGGWSGKAPFGYRNNKDKKTIEVNELEAPFVRRAFELFSKGGASVRSLPDILFKEGYFFRASQPKISKSELHYMLTNTAYISEREFEGKIYKCTHEPLIDREQFARVKKILSARARHLNKRTFLYNGALYCQSCGSAMSGELKKGGAYTYYRCWKSSNGECNQKYINEAVIDEAMDALIRRLVFPEDYEARMLAMMKRLRHTKRQAENEELNRLKNEQLRINNLVDRAYEDLVQGIITTDQFERLQKRCQEQTEAIQEAHANIPAAAVDYYAVTKMYFELPKMVSKTWFSAPVEVKRQVIKILTSNILVKDKEPLVVVDPLFSRLFINREEKEKLPR